MKGPVPNRAAVADAPAVTTIVRTYQRRARVLEAVASAHAQTLAHRQRIVVVDDASTDGTASAIRQRFGESVSVIRRHRNGGAGAAASTGLAAADTPFVAFLDSDDHWMPDYLDRMLSALEAAPEAALAYCDYRQALVALDVDRPAQCGSLRSLADLRGNPITSLSIVVARTRDLGAVGGFREDLRMGEDLDLFQRLYRRGAARFVHVPAALAELRVGDDNVTGEIECWLDHAMELLDERLHEPGQEDLRARTPDVVLNRLSGIANETAARQRMAAPVRRPVSVVLYGPPDPDRIEVSLDALTAQTVQPVEVILALTAAEPSGAGGIGRVTADRPFPIRVDRGDPAETPAAALVRAAAALQGEICALAAVGDRLVPDALARHQAALGAYGTASFSYGGTTAAPVPPALDIDPARAAETAACERAPATLSALAVSRSTLWALRGLGSGQTEWPLPALLFRLLVRRGPAVRVRAPVVEGAPDGWPPLERIAQALADAASVPDGGALTDAADAVRQRAASGAPSTP